MDGISSVFFRSAEFCLNATWAIRCCNVKEKAQVHGRGRRAGLKQVWIFLYLVGEMEEREADKMKTGQSDMQPNYDGRSSILSSFN